MVKWTFHPRCTLWDGRNDGSLSSTRVMITWYMLFQTLTCLRFWYVLSRGPPSLLNQCCSEPQLLMCVSHPSGMLTWEKKFTNRSSINLNLEGHEPNLWTKQAFTLLYKVPVRRDLNKYSVEEGPFQEFL